MEPLQRVRDLLEPLLAAENVDIFDLQIGPGIVRVYVDREGGIDMESVADATRLISDALDEADPIPGKYSLEVSSPGLERPLRTPEHFRRFVGSTVALKTKEEIDGERRFQGELTAADDTSATLTTPTGESRFTYDQIDRARTVFEWDVNPKKGRAPAPAKKRAVS